MAARADAQRLGERRRLRVAVTIIVVFVVVVLAQIVPGSPWDARRDPLNITRSPFGQRWNLFAPRPPSANLATFVVVRYHDASGEHVTEPVDLSTAVREAQRDARFAPPRLARVVTKLNVTFEAQTYSAAREAVAERIDMRAIPKSFRERVANRRADELRTYRRLLSAVAPSLVAPRSRIVAVRGLVVRMSVRTFDERSRPPIEARPVVSDADAAPALLSPDVLADVRGERRPRTALIFDSGWLSFEDDVEPLELT